MAFEAFLSRGREQGLRRTPFFASVAVHAGVLIGLLLVASFARRPPPPVTSSAHGTRGVPVRIWAPRPVRERSGASATMSADEKQATAARARRRPATNLARRASRAKLSLPVASRGTLPAAPPLPVAAPLAEEAGAPTSSPPETDAASAPGAAGLADTGLGTGKAEALDPPYVATSFARGLRVVEHYPRLPPWLSRRGAEYVTRVDICVSASGTVDDVVFRQSADPALDQALRASIRGWRYRPWMADGTPLPFCHPMLIRYAVN